MKKYSGLLCGLGLGLLVGCTATTPVDEQHIIAQAISIAPSCRTMTATRINTHGALGDQLAIQAGGGANASQTRRVLEQLSLVGGGCLVVYSQNPDLAKAVILGALADDAQYPGVTLIFASHQDDEVVRNRVLSRGMEYGYTTMAPGRK